MWGVGSDRADGLSQPLFKGREGFTWVIPGIPGPGGELAVPPVPRQPAPTCLLTGPAEPRDAVKPLVFGENKEM